MIWSSFYDGHLGRAQYSLALLVPASRSCGGEEWSSVHLYERCVFGSAHSVLLC